MRAQVMEFSYEKNSVHEIEDQLNNYLKHHEVTDVQVTRNGDQLLAFLFSEA